MEAIQVFFKEIFNYNPYLATLFISMMPVIEARIGIPFGMNKALWGGAVLSGKQALLCGFLGSSIIVPLLALTFKPVLNFAKKIKGVNKIFISLENRLNANKNELTNGGEIVYEKHKSKTNFKLIFGVLLFVLLPLPLTGVYTGTMLAVFLNIGFLNTCLAVILGNFFACLLMTSISSLINTTYVMIAVVVILICTLIIKKIRKKAK